MSISVATPTEVVRYRERMHASRNGAYTLCTKDVKRVLKACCLRWRRAVRPRFRPVLEWARWDGRISRDSTHEITNTVETTRGITRKTLPMIPGTNRRGMKAARLVRMLKVIGIITSRAPWMAASMKPIPRCRYS